MKMRLGELCAVFGLPYQGPEDQLVTRVVIDSRKVQPGDLFFCIPGEHHDGHDFAVAAVAAGAGAVVAQRPVPVAVPLLLVEDTVRALGILGRAWRDQTQAKVIGISGSAGKTTLKEMLGAVLAQLGKTSKNFRNFNNQIGLPLSLLEMEADDDFWILEAGVSVVGDMQELGEILAPDIVLLLNAGPCHVQGLGGTSGVLREKSVLLNFLPSEGLAVLNKDYAWAGAGLSTKSIRVVSFSANSQDADVVCLEQKPTDKGFTYHLCARGQEFSVQTSSAVHVPENVAALCALALECGASIAQIEAGLAAFCPAPQRFALTRCRNWTFVDDSYNANPLSMARSINEAARLAVGKEYIVVLGEMRELGQDSESAHRELGEQILHAGAHAVFFFGAEAQAVRTGLGALADRLQEIREPQELVSLLEKKRDGEGVVLFKGSRGCAMERFHMALQETWA